MRRLDGELKALTGSWGKGDDAVLIARRAAEVQAMWKDAVEHLYKEYAPYILEHTNAVYIRDDHGKKSLLLYMDDGNYRSDVHNQQHFLLLWLKERYGEDIEEFKTFPSRFDMKKRHPYGEATGGSHQGARASRPAVPLTPEERAEVADLAEKIEDTRVRTALEKAMIADREWKKGELEEI